MSTQSPPERREMLRGDTERVTVRVPKARSLVDVRIYKDRSKVIRDGIDAGLEETDAEQRGDR